MKKNQKIVEWFWMLVFLANLVIWPCIFLTHNPTPTDYSARDKLRNNLREPNSLEIIEERKVGDKTYFKYRAKNGFGGYSIEEGIY